MAASPASDSSRRPPGHLLVPKCADVRHTPELERVRTSAGYFRKMYHNVMYLR
jgi:hypothetical protein